MSNKQITNVVRAANEITTEIIGNLTGGQEVRAVEYLLILRSVLYGLEDTLETGIDSQIEKNLEAVIATANAEINKMTPFDIDLIRPSMKRWAKIGITLEMLVDHKLKTED